MQIVNETFVIYIYIPRCYVLYFINSISVGLSRRNIFYHVYTERTPQFALNKKLSYNLRGRILHRPMYLSYTIVFYCFWGGGETRMTR